jgi:histidinol-phosphate/aromatic aminotransferase/cobyric acid decarboxylase-like protein
MDIHDYAEQKRLSLKQIMDFTTSVNPLGPSNKAKHLLRKNITNIDFPPDKKLRHITRLIEKRESIEATNILFAQSLTQLLHAIFQTAKTKTILVLSPVSQTYEEAITLNRMTLKRVSLDKANHFSLDLETILKADTYQRSGPARQDPRSRRILSGFYSNGISGSGGNQIGNIDYREDLFFVLRDGRVACHI